jgi:thioredoxin 1
MSQPFSSLIQSDKPVLVDFYADWCGPCRMMKPILEEVKQTMGEKVTIIKIDVDKSPGAAETYQVSGIPTLMIFKNGQVRWRQAGVIPAKQLIRQLTTFKS